MLENLLDFYRKSDGATREKIQTAIFTNLQIRHLIYYLIIAPDECYFCFAGNGRF